MEFLKSNQHLRSFSNRSDVHKAVGINGRGESAINIFGDVFMQDQTSPIVDYYFPIPEYDLQLAEDAVLESRELVVTDASNLTIGDYIVIKEEYRSYQAEIIGISTNTLTMDIPVEYEFSTDSIIESRSIYLNVDGSVTPVIASIKPPEGTQIDINMISMGMLDSKDMDDAIFGGITELTRGIVLRKHCPAEIRNIFNAKTNGQLALRTRLEYTSKAPAGFYGLRASKYMNGPEGNGVAVRLNGNNQESLKLIIQDDLTTMENFTATVRGHIVEL